MDKKFLFLILLLVASLGVLFSTLTYYNMKIEKVENFDMHVRVDDRYGINVETDKIWFGTIPPGAGASRTFIIQGSENTNTQVQFRAFGDISKWIRLEDNNFPLQKGKNKNVTIRVQVPKNATNGKNYTGKLRAVFKKI